MTTYDLTYDRAMGPHTGPRPGTVNLKDEILGKWEGAFSKGIFNPRPIRGTEHLVPVRWSQHAQGSAVDIGVSLQPEGEVVGDEIADWLTAYASTLGVQYFIWNRQSWSHSRGWTVYRGGAGAHRDHLHIEQTTEAAETYVGPALPPLPVGPHGRQTRDFDPPRQLRPHISEAACPTGGVWVLADNGDVYARQCPYYGGPNNELRGITYEVLGSPTVIRARPHAEGRENGYTIITDLGYGYDYI